MPKPASTTLAFRICLLVCPVVAATTHAHADQGAHGPQARTRLSGHVMRSDGSPVIGRVVHLGGRRTFTTTDKDGAFVLDGVPATYDLWIDHDKEAMVTVYRGLRRRNPGLPHQAFHDLPQDRELDRHQASISGIVRGKFPFPIDKEHRLTFRFLSKEAMGGWGMGPRVSGDDNSQGPRFGRMRIAWTGKPELTGTLVAFGSRVEKSNLLLDAVLGVQTVVIRDHAETTTEMTLTELATGHIAGLVKPPGEYRPWNGYIDFRLDDGGNVPTDCRLDNAWRTEGRYDCHAPDLSVLRGQYCMDLIDGADRGSTMQHCGGKIGMTDFSPVFQPPPELRRLDRPGVVSTKTVLAWSGEGQAVYAVEIRSAYDPEARSGAKEVDLQVFTTETRLAWKELQRYGVKTPPGSKYMVSISRMFPYRTVDEFAAGLPSRTASHQRATCTPIEVKVVE